MPARVIRRSAAGLRFDSSWELHLERNLGLNPNRGPNNTGAAFTDPTNRSADYAPLPSHRLQFRTYRTFNLPIGPQQLVLENSSGVLARIIEEWQTSWIVNLNSGIPANITAQNMLYGLGVAA